MLILCNNAFGPFFFLIKTDSNTKMLFNYCLMCSLNDLDIPACDLHLCLHRHITLHNSWEIMFNMVFPMMLYVLGASEKKTLPIPFLVNYQMTLFPLFPH